MTEVRHRQLGSRYQWTGSRWDLTTNPRTLIAHHTCQEGLTEVCDDIVGNRTGANPVDIVRNVEFYPRLNGKLEAWWAPGNYLVQLDEVPCDYQPGPPDPRSEFPGYTFVELSDLAWKILANTNPSVPSVSVPTFLVELRDLPGLIRNCGGDFLKRTFNQTRNSAMKGWMRRIGENIKQMLRDAKWPDDSPITYLKHAANANLSWRWGIKPLIGDLRLLAKFASETHRRINELRNLRDGKTLRKRCSLGTFSVTKPDEYKFLHSGGYGVEGWSRRVYTAKVWGSAEWKILPDTELPKMDDGELKRFAQRLSLGITSHEAMATLWETTPWSWLADWFGNVGDLIAATNNTVGCTWGRICVMRTMKGTNHVRVNEFAGSTWATLSGSWRLEQTRKERIPVYPVIPFPLPHLPVLNAGKWSILASLAALRA